jgi:hypothetical protein
LGRFSRQLVGDSLEHQTQLTQEGRRQGHDTISVVLAKANKMEGGPSEAQGLRVEIRSLADAQCSPPDVLDDMLATGERDNEHRVEIDPVGILPGDVVQLFGDTTGVHATTVGGMSRHAARPER